MKEKQQRRIIKNENTYKLTLLLLSYTQSFILSYLKTHLKPRRNTTGAKRVHISLWECTLRYSDKFCERSHDFILFCCKLAHLEFNKLLNLKSTGPKGCLNDISLTLHVGLLLW